MTPDAEANLPGLDADATLEPGGPVVTALVPLPSNPNLLSVRVGRRAMARIAASFANELSLQVGSPWTPELEETIAHRARRDRARSETMRLLGQRDFTRNELARRLSDKGYSADLVVSLLDELADEGWIDEPALAKRYVAELTRTRPAAAEYLIDKLVNRGFPARLASETVAQSLAGVDPQAAAEVCARERLPSLASLKPATQARRLAGHLARRGFDEDTTRETLVRLGLLDPDAPG